MVESILCLVAHAEKLPTKMNSHTHTETALDIVNVIAGNQRKTVHKTTNTNTFKIKQFIIFCF